MIVQIFFFNLQNSPTFHSEERLVNLARGRVCFVVLSIYIISLWCAVPEVWRADRSQAVLW